MLSCPADMFTIVITTTLTSIQYPMSQSANTSWPPLPSQLKSNTISLEAFYCWICSMFLPASRPDHHLELRKKNATWMFSNQENNTTFLRVYKSHHKCWQYPEICTFLLNFFFYFLSKAEKYFYSLFSTPIERRIAKVLQYFMSFSYCAPSVMRLLLLQLELLVVGQ